VLCDQLGHDPVDVVGEQAEGAVEQRAQDGVGTGALGRVRVGHGVSLAR
jgi:hypothetical protein